MTRGSERIKGELKSILQSINEVKIRKNNSPKRQHKKTSQMFAEEKEIAGRYRKLFCGVESVEKKLQELRNAKEGISKERYLALENEYVELLNQSKPILVTVSEKIDTDMTHLLEEIEGIETELSEIQSLINQEKKLYEVGAISKVEYAKKIAPLQTKEIKITNKYKHKYTQIKILKNAITNPREISYGEFDSEVADYIGFVERFLAHLIDIVILFIINLIFLFIPILNILVGILSSFLYFSIFESSKYQASIGKQILKIKIVTLSGERIPYKQSAIRSVLKCLFLFPSILTIFFTDNKQSLHDIIANTLVVKG